MQIIKKYANRKLYHTNRKQYITLEGIAGLVQANEHVQVIDNESGEDITAPIMAQVALHTRGRKSALPTHVLTSLIQTSNDALSGLRRSVWNAIGSAVDIDGEIRRRVQALRESNLVDEAEATRMLDLLLAHSFAPSSPGYTSDIARLNAQVDALTKAVEQLVDERKQQ